MLTPDIAAALERAIIEQFDDGTWYAEVLGLSGAYATAATERDVRETLASVLVGWWCLRQRHRLPVPTLALLAALASSVEGIMAPDVCWFAAARPTFGPVLAQLVASLRDALPDAALALWIATDSEEGDQTAVLGIDLSGSASTAARARFDAALARLWGGTVRKAVMGELLVILVV